MEQGLESIFGIQAISEFQDKVQTIRDDALVLTTSIQDMLSWMSKNSDNEVYTDVINKVTDRLREELIVQMDTESITDILSSPEKAQEDIYRDFRIIQNILNDLRLEYTKF